MKFLAGSLHSVNQEAAEPPPSPQLSLGSCWILSNLTLSDFLTSRSSTRFLTYDLLQRSTLNFYLVQTIHNVPYNSLQSSPRPRPPLLHTGLSLDRAPNRH